MSPANNLLLFALALWYFRDAEQFWYIDWSVVLLPVGHSEQAAIVSLVESVTITVVVTNPYALEY